MSVSKPPADWAGAAGDRICGDARLSRILTGQPLPRRKYLVDVITFTYELDLLEARLYEYNDL